MHTQDQNTTSNQCREQELGLWHRAELMRMKPKVKDVTLFTLSMKKSN